MGKFAAVRKVPLLGEVIYNVYMKGKKYKWHRSNVKRCQQLDISREVKKVFYLGTPTHPNLGDLAQYVCIKKWLKENYSDYEIIELDGMFLSDVESGLIEKMKKAINTEDLIFFQSGYCTHDLGAYHDLIHRTIVDNFHGVPIIMMPQTVYFKEEKNAQRVAKSYAAHNKIFFMARDIVSAQTAKKIFPSLPVNTYPDIVTTMIGTRRTSSNKRWGIIICVRNDEEKFYSDAEIENLSRELSEVSEVKICDTTINKDFDELKNEKENYINRMIDEFQKAKVVITDRYHGTIFSLIAGTPVIVIKTTDHKVKTGVEWFKGVYDEYVYYADSLGEASSKAREFCNKKFSYQLSPYFKEQYYDKLKDVIENWKNN